MAIHRSRLGLVLGATLSGLLACTTAPTGASLAEPNLSSNDNADASTSTPPSAFAGSSVGDASTPASCLPPDMLIALDRTMTMSRMTNGQFPSNDPNGHDQSKFFQAIAAIKTLTAAPRDEGIRFGLELWPKNEKGCLTLGQVLGAQPSANPSCSEGEILVSPALGSADLIGGSLDPELTALCFSTPTGTALEGAKDALLKKKEAGRSQYVVLVTDGADWNLSCPTPNPVQVVDELATAGIKTVIVGFSAEASVLGGVGAGFLNDMACAGGSSVGFPSGCRKTADGSFRYDASAGAGNVFFSAANPGQLTEDLAKLADATGCSSPLK